jgi:hypothetical protein
MANRLTLTAILFFGALLFHPLPTEGKTQLPIDLSIELGADATPGSPISLLISAHSGIPFENGMLSLGIPPIGENTDETHLLWSGKGEAMESLTEELILDPLPEGKYRFIATFEVTPRDAGRRSFKTSKSLYVEVRRDLVHSSTISFNHIKSMELKRKLEQRGLGQASKARIKAEAPDLMKEIEELHRLETLESGAERSGSPSSSGAVPDYSSTEQAREKRGVIR